VSWHFTKYGFFSSVCARENDGAGAVDPTVRMIRVRSKKHLANLRARFPVELDGVEVLESDTADYPARVLLPTATWVAMLTAMELEVDYDNFKGAVEKAKLTEPAFLSGLHRVWATLRSFQDELSREGVLAKLRSFRGARTAVGVLPPGEVPEKHRARVTPKDVLAGETVAIVSIRLEVGESDAVPAAIVLGASSLDNRTLLADLVDGGMMGDIEPERVRVDRVPWRRVDKGLHVLPIFDLLYESKPS
jgi:hypothetical protein